VTWKADATPNTPEASLENYLHVNDYKIVTRNWLRSSKKQNTPPAIGYT
jgi:hypothetical protein